MYYTVDILVLPRSKSAALRKERKKSWVDAGGYQRKLVVRKSVHVFRYHARRFR